MARRNPSKLVWILLLGGGAAAGLFFFMRRRQYAAESIIPGAGQEALYPPAPAVPAQPDKYSQVLPPKETFRQRQERIRREKAIASFRAVPGTTVAFTQG